MKKFFQSLLMKYMLIILLAISLIQLTYIGIAIFVAGVAKNDDVKNQSEGRNNLDVIEEQWHAGANGIENPTAEIIEQYFATWNSQYEDASMFWIDQNGKLQTNVNLEKQLPLEWSATFTAKFIKERYGGNPYTVIAFLGTEEADGFIVLEIPKSALNPPLRNVYDQYGTILFIGTITIILLFMTISFLFFKGIRKRLLQLQTAMEFRDVDDLPIEIQVKKNDEIGQLENTFNRMVFELRESKQREQQEEQLRRELIANLSHDLRTPLTKVRAQTYSISKEFLSEDGEKSRKAIEASVIKMDNLIENLMSYSLLMASKYKYEPKNIDMTRYLRESLALWYPVFEKEDFEIDVQIENFTQSEWLVDPLWMGRILDNLLQNILRHAKTGAYICVKTEATDQYDAIVITDRGKGMQHKSDMAGAGIGLSIVDMMVKGMNLYWTIHSDKNGTTIKIKRAKLRSV